VDLKEYFQQSNTPAEFSPTGTLMVKVLAKNPGMAFDLARAEANNLLSQAAGRKHYSIPRVLSPSEKVESKKQLAAFVQSKAVQATIYNAQS
jgi:hypothetical protein